MINRLNQFIPPTEVLDVGVTPHRGFMSTSSNICIVQVPVLDFHSRITISC